MTKWISVEDELPSDHKNVIVYANDIVMSWVETAWYGDDFWHDAEGEECYIPDVTHWQPLPDPPKQNSPN